MDLQALAAGIGAICTGAGGTVIVIREFRRRDRRAMQKDIDGMSEEIRLLHADLILCRRYAFDVAALLVEQGAEVPPVPALHKMGEFKA